MKSFFCYMLVIFSMTSAAQNHFNEVSLELTGMAGTEENLPFWFIHNQLGRYTETSAWQEFNEAFVQGDYVISPNLQLTYGADFGLRVSSEEVSPMIIQTYAGLIGKTFSFKAGSFADEVIMSGLSSGNGQLIRSANFRPYPKFRLSTTGFIPFLFAKQWFRFKAEYDEGLLTDERVVDRPHLHHKSLHLQFLPGATFRFSLGMEHYVFWGGTLPDGTKLPDDLKAYFRYITGKSGSDEFLMTDQLNVAGNQLGAYLVTFEKELANLRVELRISHPFEDHSGMEFDNLKDNLYTLYVCRKNSGELFDAFVFEYLYTKNQSGPIHRITGPKEDRVRGADSYFNHGVYQSGFTYRGSSMGTPLFSPVNIGTDGIVRGVSNNRVSAFHLGATGYLLPQKLKWKALLTFSRNFGTYGAPFLPPKNQINSLGELSWKSKNNHYEFSTQLAADYGKLSPVGIGVGFSLKRHFN